MLIPINFKADIEGNQKGNVRPEDLGAILSFCNPYEAGILNITGQDVSQFGTIDIVGATAQLTFHKGYIFIQGRLIYIEEGTQVAFNLPTSTTAIGVIGVKINLAENGTNEVSWFQKTTNLQKDNLLSKSSTGVYEFAIYNYTATPSTFTLGLKTAQIIENVKNADFETLANNVSNKKAATTEYVHNYLDTKINLSNSTGMIAYGSTNSTANVNNVRDWVDISSRLSFEYVSRIDNMRIYFGEITPANIIGYSWYKIYLPYNGNKKMAFVTNSRISSGNDYNPVVVYDDNHVYIGDSNNNTKTIQFSIYVFE